ncbi:hypothetical protein ACMD2_11559 [Ananas comosus]|uniref:Chromo domain-containing protein n=1 Tax=Ananas comosus TaxID=4615 RepID=A0A199VEN1_ANACO|nr:hypothetical protein ACMD2_11559 [Ananas comosus]
MIVWLCYLVFTAKASKQHIDSLVMCFDLVDRGSALYALAPGFGHGTGLFLPFDDLLVGVPQGAEISYNGEPDVTIEFSDEFEENIPIPTNILAKLKPKILVRWNKQSQDEDTWENEDEMRQKYFNIAPEGQGAS